jgi:hypothetical protein
MEAKNGNATANGNMNNDDDDDDDDIQVLDPLEVNTLFCAPVRSTTTATGTNTTSASASASNDNDGDDNDIELVGTKNHVLLPHMRQHCTEKTFQSNTGYSTAARRAVNAQFCTHCYCYVCDVLVSECASWEAHCLATDQGVMKHGWQEKRQQAKRKRNAAAAVAARAAATATAPSTMAASTALPIPQESAAANIAARLAALTPLVSRRPATATTGAVPRTSSAATATTTSHNREDCPVRKFNAMSAGTNRQYCGKCVCYVCQKPPGMCRDWFKPYGPSGLRDNHCNATIHNGEATMEFWELQRRLASETSKLERAHEAAQLAAQQAEALRPKAVGPGPFEPTNEAAGEDKDLTQCRKCQWYNRFRTAANTPVPGPGSPEARRPTVFVKHWCHACGRVASETSFGKDQSNPYVSLPGDVSLGTKTIHFRLHAHDPRHMSKFEHNWAVNKGKPEWTYNEQEMEEELFRHRFGKRPTLSTILASIPVLAPDEIPKDGRIGSPAGPSDEMASASETQAILLDNPNDVVVFQEIQRNSSTFGQGTRTYQHDPLSGDITAHWDSNERKGVSLLLRMHA